MNTPEIKGPARAVDVPQVFDAILDSLAAAQAAGDMPARHAPPPRESSIVFWIGTKRGLTAYASVFEPFDGVIWLDVLWVAPAYRGRGLGKAMVATVAAIARDNGMKKMEFGTQPENAGMRGLGALLGFSDKAVVMGRQL